MMRVIAPSTLPGGYEIEVESKNQAPFQVTIPEGGVQKGDVFLAPMPIGHKMEDLISIPRGRWKDGIFECFRYGVFHPHIWCSLICNEIAMAQVMERMRFSWIGNRTMSDRALNTYRTVLILVVCYYIFNTALFLAMGQNVNYYYDIQDFNPTIVIAKNVGALLFTVWSVYALYKTRRNVREEFSIPEERCIGCEDCLCATFCCVCTVAQMSRHTGDYDQYPGVCCSETGLPDHAPLAAPMAV